MGYSYTDQWKDQAASVDVSSLLVRGRPLDIVDGMVEGVEIHQVYKTISQLEDAAPQIYLKKAGKCFEFSNGKVFIDYSVESQKDPVGLMVLDDVSGYDFKRYRGGDLNKINFNICKLKR